MIIIPEKLRVPLNKTLITNVLFLLYEVIYEQCHKRDTKFAHSNKPQSADKTLTILKGFPLIYSIGRAKGAHT